MELGAPFELCLKHEFVARLVERLGAWVDAERDVDSDQLAGNGGLPVDLRVDVVAELLQSFDLVLYVATEYVLPEVATLLEP